MESFVISRNSKTIVFDPLAPEFAEDPYKTYDIMRELDEPFYYSDIDTWMLTKINDVESVALNKTMVRGLHDRLTKEELLDQQRKMNWHEIPLSKNSDTKNLNTTTCLSG